jgi:chemotaxis protein MotC
MSRFFSTIAIGAAFLFTHPPMPAIAGNPWQLRDTMRAIEKLQDSVVAGDVDAAKYSTQLMLQFETDLAATPDDQLNDPRNILSIVVYLLSGGNPGVDEMRLRKIKIDPKYEVLLGGAMTYANGDKEGASAKLSAIDVNELPLEVSGRLLLIQAILISEKDTEGALSLLEKASARMPGTIVDEAALRRCSAFAAKLNRFSVFDACASKMIRHFPNSPYWPEFSSTFVNYVANVKEQDAHIFSSWLIPMLSDLALASQLEVLLSISKIGVVNGNYVLANLCASRAGILSRKNSTEFSRGMLYSGAALIGLKQIAVAAYRLKMVDPSLLQKDDHTLLQRAADISQQILSVAIEDGNLSQSPADISHDVQTQQFNNVVLRAKEALKIVSTEITSP